MAKELTEDELDMVSGGVGPADEEPPSIPKYQAPAVKKAQASQKQYHASTPDPAKTELDSILGSVK